MRRCSVPTVRADEVTDPLPELSADQIDEIRRGVRNAAAASHTELARVCAGYCEHFNISYQTIRKLADVPLPNYLDIGSTTRARQPVQPPTSSLTAEQTAALLDAYRDTFLTSKPTAAARECIEAFALQFEVPTAAIREVLATDERANRQQYGALREAGKRQRAAAAEKEQQQRAEAKRRAAEEAQRKKQLKDMPKGMRVEDYVSRATHCPVCARDFGTNRIPPHGKPHACRGSGRLGATLCSIHQARRENDKSRRASGSRSVRTVGGGLPGLGHLA